jgi:protein TonB
MKVLGGKTAGGLLLFVAALLFVPVSSSAQESANKRKLLDHAAPAYPALARNMALQGVVKLEVLVAADGSVKTVDVQGGHPVLAQAAMNAVRRWKWEPRTHESREAIQLKFSPSD